MKMFRSSVLIEEVRKKRSLWDSAYKQPSEKGLRAREWLEVTESLFPNWNELNAHEKRESVQAVKRKWKHIRDYYKKGSRNWNGRKYVYSHLLGFLSGDGTPRNSTSSIQTEDLDIPSIQLQKTEMFECQNDELSQNESICGSEDMPVQEFIIAEHFSVESEEVKPTDQSQAAKTCLQSRSEPQECEHDPSFVNIKRNQNDQCMDADRCFLLSLLPEMRNMNGLQKIGFKISVLNELASIMREQRSFTIKEEPYS